MMSDNLIPEAAFNIRIKDGLQKHPFVRKRVIPALEKTHAKQITLLKQKYKSEREDFIWFHIFRDLVKHYTTLLGKDRGLSFFLLRGGAFQHVVWDNLNKALYSDDSFSFDLPLHNNPGGGVLDEDNQVSLRGKLSTAIRNGERYAVLKIYFYVHDSKIEFARQPGDTTVSKNVGLLCEVPYFFLRSDRYNTFQDTDITNKLLDMFELKKEDPGNMDLDFIPTNELGESYGSSFGTEIGNDCVGVYIR